MRIADMTPAQHRARNEYMRLYMRKRSRRLKLEQGRKRFWSLEAVEWLWQAYPNQPTAKLALAMGRPTTHVYAKAAKLGIRKTAAFFQSDAAARIQRGVAPGAVRHQFPKGHVPANKGLRRPGWSPGRMKETQFKKGQMPHNGRHQLQAERINADGYLDRKISMTAKGARAWIGAHRLVWMAAHGDIPPDHNRHLQGRQQAELRAREPRAHHPASEHGAQHHSQPAQTARGARPAARRAGASDQPKGKT